MKKTLSLVLAAVLAFGGAVSAFAVAGTFEKATADVKFQSGASANVYKWDSDAGYFTTNPGIGANYGALIGFIITDADNDFAKKSEEVKNLKAYPEYQIPNSSTLVEKTAVEYKKFMNPATSQQAYAYFVTMKTKASTSASPSDLYGTMYVGTSKSNAQAAGRGAGFTFSLNNYEDPDSSASSSSNNGSYTVPGTKNPSNWTLDFKGETDVDIDFNGLATFTVDATGQSKLNCGYTTKFNSEFAAKYPEANLNFLTWGAKPSFNRIGELTLYAEPDTFLYQLTDDGFKEVNAKYDEDYEAFVFKTRTLGAFVVSDIELEAEVIDEVPVTPEVPGTNPPTGGVIEVPNNGGKPNPNTGR